jgi:hypothetical protein
MSTSTANITEVRPSGVTHSSNEVSMHAVVLNVTVTDEHAALAALRDQVVPRVRNARIRRGVLGSARQGPWDGGGCVRV